MSSTSSDVVAVRKQLKIKTGVVKRLMKELNLYRKEHEEQVIRVEKLKGEGADGADIRHAETVLKEAATMIPDAQTRMEKSVAELKDLTIHAETIAGMNEEAELIQAKEVLQAAES